MTDIETTLEREPEFFRALVENSEDLIVVLDREARLVYMSPSVGRILGYTEPCEIALELWDFIHPDDLAPSLAAYQSVVAEGRTGQAVELRVSHRDGSWRDFAARASVMTDAGHGGRLVVNGHDITERKRAEAKQRLMEEALVQAQKLESLGELAGGIAHDFNNILGAIMGHASLALGKLPQDDPARRNLTAVLDASERAASLSRKMLAFSGRGQFELRRLELGRFLAENQRLLEAGVPKEIRLELLPGDQPLPLETDPRQLSQALVSLVLNAVEAIGPHHGTIRVSARLREVTAGDTDLVGATGTLLAPGHYVGLAVEDDGSGIEPTILHRIFEPFFTTKFTGRGLGLSTVLGIVRGHRGGIAVASTPERGSRFELLFPVTEAAAGAVEATPKPTGRGVLVVDDERALRDVVLETLNAEGIPAWGASDGAQAVQLLDELRDSIAVVMLDVSMPGMKGEETLRTLRSRGSAVKVLLTSGHAEAALAPVLGDARPDAFLQKPYRTAALLEAMKRLLGPHGATTDG